MTAATLFWVALTDLREFKVRNELIIILVLLYVVYALFSGAWVSMQWNFGFALLMLIGGTYAYSLQHIGGGDLKLLTVAFLWTGPWLAAPFVILLLIFTVAVLCRRSGRLGRGAAHLRGASNSPGSLVGRGAYRSVCVGSNRPAQLRISKRAPDAAAGDATSCLRSYR